MLLYKIYIKVVYFFSFSKICGIRKMISIILNHFKLTQLISKHLGRLVLVSITLQNAYMIWVLFSRSIISSNPPFPVPTTFKLFVCPSYPNMALIKSVHFLLFLILLLSTYINNFYIHICENYVCKHSRTRSTRISTQ